MTTESELTVSNFFAANATENLQAEDQIDFPHVSQAQLAWQDIKEGAANWRIWLMLAYQDTKLRYRRSVLGPFWITISMAITVYTMGYLYGHLFHVELAHYYPFLVGGMLGWTLVSTTVTDYTESLVVEGLLKQIKLPYTTYIHRIAARNIIIFFHNLLVIIPIFVIYHQSIRINWQILMLLPGLAIFFVNAAAYGLVLAMIGARYRDMTQVIKSLVQVVFFVTPIMWTPEILGEKNRWMVDINPFYAFLELIRAPLISTLPTLKNLIVVFIMSACGILLSTFMLVRYRARIIYWI